MTTRRHVLWAIFALGCGATEPRDAAVRSPAPTLPSVAPEPAAEPAPPAGPAVPEASQSAREFVRVQRQLARFRSVEDLTSPTYDLQVPAAARPLLEDLKRRGGEVIRTRLAELLTSDRAADDLGPLALEEFTRAGAVTEYQAQSFGTLDGVDIAPDKGHDRLYAAVLTLGLPCGSDSTLFLQRWDGAALVPVLTVSSDDYVSIADGQLALGYAISPPNASGDFHVLTAHTTPWCSSAWRQLKYGVYAPSADGERPRRLLQGSSDVWIGNRLARLEATRDRVEIEFDSWDRLGMNVTRGVARAYERQGTTFVPATPELENLEDVPNAWLALDWERAKMLVIGRRRANLRAVHARLQAAIATESGVVELERQSKVSAVVRFTCDDCSMLPKRARFVLAKQGGRWMLADVVELSPAARAP
jgi:hypothetical protein